MASCGTKQTTVLVLAKAVDGVTINGLGVDVSVSGLGEKQSALPQSGKPIMLPGHLVVRTPDFASDVQVSLGGSQPDGPTLSTTCSVRTIPFEQVSMTIVLGATPPDDCLVTCAPDSPPSAQCWDVAGTFTQIDFPRSDGSTRIFGIKPTVGQTVFADLDTEDSSYVESAETCNKMPRDVAESWFIERKHGIEDGTWILNVNGRSASDCGRTRAAAAGHIEVNGARGWKITSMLACDVDGDASGAETHCTVDMENGKIDWKSGSTCGQCCACSDGANVNIQVVVSQ